MIQGIRPDKEIFSGVITFISGVLFLIPGFLTDFIALLLLFSPIKNTLIQSLPVLIAVNADIVQEESTLALLALLVM